MPYKHRAKRASQLKGGRKLMWKLLLRLREYSVDEVGVMCAKYLRRRGLANKIRQPLELKPPPMTR